MVTQNTASNASVIESEAEAKEILKEWSDYVSEVEKDLGLKPFKRANPAQQKLLKDSEAAYTMYSLQEGVQLQFWKAFTFANTRVDDNYILEDLKQTAYCPHPFTDLGVLWNGDVTLCALDHDGHLKVGNINETPLEQLIQGPEARKLRACMLGDGALPNICKTCQAKPVKRD